MLDLRDALRRAVDMALVDRLGGQPQVTEPIQYVQGVVNGMTAVTEMLLEQGALHPAFIDGSDLKAAVPTEIERMTR